MSSATIDNTRETALSKLCGPFAQKTGIPVKSGDLLVTINEAGIILARPSLDDSPVEQCTTAFMTALGKQQGCRVTKPFGEIVCKDGLEGLLAAIASLEP